jgi:hypothetical protein
LFAVAAAEQEGEPFQVLADGLREITARLLPPRRRRSNPRVVAVTERRGSHPMLPLAIFRPAQFRAANAVTFVVNGALGGFAFVFIPALEIIAGYSPVVAGSALVPVTVVTLLLSGTSGQLAARIGPRPQLVAGCLLCTVAAVLAVRIGPGAGYWTVVLPVAVLFGLGLASLLPPLTATAMNSAPDSLAGLASGVNNAVARVGGLLLDCRPAAYHRPHRCGLHRPGAVPVQLRPDQLDLRGSVRLRRSARRNLHLWTSPPHPGTTAGARSNSGAPPHLPSRLPPRTVFIESKRAGAGPGGRRHRRSSPLGRRPGHRWPPAVRPGSAAVPGGWRAHLSSRNPSQFKVPVLADAGDQGRFSPFESGRRGSGYGTTECSFRRGSFDRLSDLGWRT